MSLELRTDKNDGQSPGCDPKTSTAKRNSGLFAFLKWFKPSSSRESIDTQNSSNSSSPSSSSSSSSSSSTISLRGSNESLDSVRSNGTVASFSYVQPNVYQSQNDRHKSISPGPETDTYRARLKQRDKRREHDKNLTLRKKYNLFFNRDTLLKNVKQEDNTKSLPLMTKTMDDEKMHRRSNSESSKTKKAGAYVHVKGKRKAPQPPGLVHSNPSTLTLRRKKRNAPVPPTPEKSQSQTNVLENDSLRLEQGVLKPAKEEKNEDKKNVQLKAPVSPKPWYKRNSTIRNSTVDIDIKIKKAEETKRKSGISFLTNISELDREASEIIKKEKNNSELPQFMRPKDETTGDSWVAPNRRRSAKDLIAKFNAITNVTKATVFGVSANPKRDYFGRRTSLEQVQTKQENILENHKKKIDEIDRKLNPIMKSESTGAVLKTTKLESSPKIERKNWKCPKCNLENEYWRIICHVCSAIKPYFDDFSSGTKDEAKAKEETVIAGDRGLERSKTQIGFSALATYNQQNSRKNFGKSVSLEEKSNERGHKEDERERLKKMLIEMKNSLPSRKPNMLMKQNSRSSVIMENPEESEQKESDESDEEPLYEDKPKVVEVVVATSETIYENIKVKKTDKGKPLKISNSAQTTSILKQAEAKQQDQQTDLRPDKKFEPMKPKEFETIYSDTANPNKIYANLARNDELSLFFNVPANISQMKTNLSKINSNTIEVNRLLRRLESAIAKGELTEAASFAKELAQLKINCSVIRQRPNGPSKKKGFNIEMYVEDKISHRGPFSLEVTETQTVAELKKQVEEEFDIPMAVQRWILGKELASDDSQTLKEHNITTERCPVFLYLVAPTEPKVEIDPTAPSTSKEPASSAKPKVVEVIPKIPDVVPSCSKTQVVESPITLAKEEDFEEYDAKTLRPANNKEWECHLCTLLNPQASNICAVCATVRLKRPVSMASGKVTPAAPQPHDLTYLQLVNLDNKELVGNAEAFECVVCFADIGPGDGVTLRECLHQFCKQCLAQTVQHNDGAEVKCPYRDAQYSCNIALQDREIKALVTADVYDNYLARSVAEAENKIGNKSFHCKTPDCKGWCIFEDNVNEFKCPVCRRLNCLTCQAIHSGMNCKQYQEKMNLASEIDEDAKRTKDMVDEMMKNGEALKCPTCQVILMKKWGCDWVRCSMCKTEICWVTRGPRWGPAGKGDTTGGCQCGVNGVKCHPKCSYCH